jgi:hypothetical protein
MKKLSRKQQRDRLADQRHHEERVRKGSCAPGYDGPCWGPTQADYEWADQQMASLDAIDTLIEMSEGTQL